MMIGIRLFLCLIHAFICIKKFYLSRKSEGHNVSFLFQEIRLFELYVYNNHKTTFYPVYERKQLFQLSLYIFLQYTYIESHKNLYAFVLMTQRKYKHRCLERPLPGPQNAKAFFHHKCWRSCLSFMEKQEAYKQGLLQEWLWCVMGWQVEAILSYCLNSKPTLPYSAYDTGPKTLLTIQALPAVPYQAPSIEGAPGRRKSRRK